MLAIFWEKGIIPIWSYPLFIIFAMNSYELSDYKNIMRANNLQIIDQAFKEDYEIRLYNIDITDVECEYMLAKDTDNIKRLFLGMLNHHI